MGSQGPPHKTTVYAQPTACKNRTERRDNPDIRVHQVPQGREGCPRRLVIIHLSLTPAQTAAYPQRALQIERFRPNWGWGVSFLHYNPEAVLLEGRLLKIQGFSKNGGLSALTPSPSPSFGRGEAHALPSPRGGRRVGDEGKPTEKNRHPQLKHSNLDSRWGFLFFQGS